MCTRAGTKLELERFTLAPFLETAMKTLADAFEHTLQDVYYAENAITKALPKVIKAVSNADLKAALADHLDETKGQIKTLQAIFKSIGKKASGEKCDAIEGLIKETEGVIEEAKGAVARHATIIAARRSSTTKSRDMVRCANGPKLSASPRPTSCCLKFWIRKRRPTLN
jgi:hypothetical protein